MVEAAHTSVASALVYNDENSLSCTVMLAYIAAKNDYLLIREFPSGKGFADIVFLPKRGIDKPSMVVELKWNQSADGAIAQIKEKKYSKALEDFGGDILLVGISYDWATKIHDCKIEVTV